MGVGGGGGGGNAPLPFLLGFDGLLSPSPVVLPTPLLPTWRAWAACLGMTALYVFSLYFLPAAVRRRPRDDAAHIRARIVAVATACLLALRWVRRGWGCDLPEGC